MRVRSMLFHVVSLTIGCLIGLGLGWSRSREESEPVLHVAKAPSPDAPACSSLVQNLSQTPPLSLLSLADIRAIVREEIRTGLAEQGARSQDSREEAQPAEGEAVERQQLTYEEASQRVQRAIGYGRWTQEDRQRLRGVLHELTVPQQDQVIGDLFSAIQSGRLKVDGEAAPL